MQTAHLNAHADVSSKTKSKFWSEPSSASILMSLCCLVNSIVLVDMLSIALG